MSATCCGTAARAARPATASFAWAWPTAPTASVSSGILAIPSCNSPTVLKIDDDYLMWYGSYFNATRRETTAIGFAVSRDGIDWTKHPQNPVLRPDSQRPWESNYVGSGCVLRLADGTFRYWYASRKA